MASWSLATCSYSRRTLDQPSPSARGWSCHAHAVQRSYGPSDIGYEADAGFYRTALLGPDDHGGLCSADPLLAKPDRAGSLPGTHGSAQVTAAGVLSVVVLRAPCFSVRCGTRVARPMRTNLVRTRRLGDADPRPAGSSYPGGARDSTRSPCSFENPTPSVAVSGGPRSYLPTACLSGSRFS
jgi:hypothetical protein